MTPTPYVTAFPHADGLTLEAFTHDEYVTRSLRERGTYSPAELALCKSFLTKGDLVVVVGANIGAMAVPLAAHVHPGPVLAFEPQRIARDILGGNAHRNGCDNLVAIDAALGHEEGAVQIPALDPRFPDNFGGVSLGRGPQVVAVRRLDDFNLPKLRLLHIDAEGMEPHVLEGARETIAAHKPVIYAEVDRPDAQAATLRFLRDAGYRLWLHEPPLVAQYVSFNVLALPESEPAPADDGHLTAL